MISVFRKFFQSKIGIALTLAFLGVIALAFAAMDIGGNTTFGGVASGERVAVVGSSRISTSDLRGGVDSALGNIRQQNPAVTQEQFLAEGGLEQTLDGMIERFAMADYGRSIGLRAGPNLVNSEIMALPAFAGPDGQFSQDAYNAFLQQRGLKDSVVRDDLSQGLLAQQLMVPASFGARAPQQIVERYAGLLRERRKGSIALLPATAFAPEGTPPSARVAEYYQENRADYTRPERRVLRYASFGADTLEVAAPSPAAIAARYKRDAEKYAAREERSFTQLVVPTQQAATSLRNRAAGGASLDSLASEAGLSTTKVEEVTRTQFGTAASQAVAKAAFEASRGSYAAVAQGQLGWYVLRVDSVSTTPASSLAQATPEIREELTVEKERTAFLELGEQVEDMIADGSTFAEVAKLIGAETRRSAPLIATGQVYGEDEQAPDALLPVVETAFQMEEQEPQVAQNPQTGDFVLFDVAEITPSAIPPLAEIRGRVSADYTRSEGNKGAAAAARRIIEKVNNGGALAAAISAEKADLPPARPIDLGLRELSQFGQRIPAPLALLFSMAQDTVKRLEAPGGNGWFVVLLDEIIPAEIDEEADAEALASAGVTLSRVVGQEYATQFRSAMREERGVEKNDAAIEAVRRELTGEDQT